MWVNNHNCEIWALSFADVDVKVYANWMMVDATVPFPSSFNSAIAALNDAFASIKSSSLMMSNLEFRGRFPDINRENACSFLTKSLCSVSHPRVECPSKNEPRIQSLIGKCFEVFPCVGLPSDTLLVNWLPWHLIWRFLLINEHVFLFVFVDGRQFESFQPPCLFMR